MLGRYFHWILKSFELEWMQQVERVVCGIMSPLLLSVHTYFKPFFRYSVHDKQISYDFRNICGERKRQWGRDFNGGCSSVRRIYSKYVWHGRRTQWWITCISTIYLNGNEENIMKINEQIRSILEFRMKGVEGLRNRANSFMSRVSNADWNGMRIESIREKILLKIEISPTIRAKAF